ncbi:uncharacterized protein METZ01_LOCUS345382, partial [marine metagenome]
MKGKNQVDINTGTPLSKNKSFSRKRRLKVEFIGEVPKNTKQKVVTLI